MVAKETEIYKTNVINDAQERARKDGVDEVAKKHVMSAVGAISQGRHNAAKAKEIIGALLTGLAISRFTTDEFWADTTGLSLENGIVFAAGIIGGTLLGSALSEWAWPDLGRIKKSLSNLFGTKKSAE